MKRPYIICHMMTAVDGRIDCAMTEHLPGVQDYYTTLDALDAPSRVSGRVTALLELAAGPYDGEKTEPIGREGYFKAREAEGYEIVADTHGTLSWDDQTDSGRPVLVLTSEQTDRAYLEYLTGRGVSWIACGGERIDLARACDILAEHFGVRRMAVVGGGHVNAGFLAAGLLDEVSILIGAGIDGRGGMAAVFDGLPMDRPVTPLKLKSAQPYESGAVWLRYDVKN